MTTSFQADLATPGQFVITLELVPGPELHGSTVDSVMGMARDALTDGRLSAISITDNPGGNPSPSAPTRSAEISVRWGWTRSFTLPAAT